MKYTKDTFDEGLYNKLNDLFGREEMTQPLVDYFFNIIKQCPEEITPNILEWVNGDPYSEIDCHGISIKFMVDSLSLTNIQMPQLFKNFAYFKKNNYKGNAICYYCLE